MRQTVRTGRGIVTIAMFTCLVLAGCGSGGDSPEPTVTATMPPPATSTATPVAIGEIVWTATVDPATNVPTDTLVAVPNDAPRVIAAVSFDVLPAGTELVAHWTIDGAPLPRLDPPPMTVEQDRADAWAAWTLNWTADQRWPTGTLGIVVDVGDAEQVSSEIPIVRAND